jgi:Ca-activated chloride channel family protein
VLDQMHESPSLIPATDRNRWSILEWLGTIEARGGTEMELALKAGLALLKRPRKKKGEPKPTASDAPARDPILVLVTDGQVGDEDRVLARLVKSLGATTLHVVGIDTSANAGLLTRLADSSGGTHDIVESEDRLDEVMDRIQERLVAPIVTDVRLEGDGIEIVDDSVVPAKRPSLFPGVPLVLRGRVQGAGPGNVTIRGKKQGGSTWVAVTPHNSQAPGLGALWARGRLQHLSDVYAVGDHGDSEVLEHRIVDLSTGFGVLCKFTAVVAIDPRLPETPIEASTLRQIVQPVFDVNLVRRQLCHLIPPQSSFGFFEAAHSFPLCDYSEASPMSEARAQSIADSQGCDVGDLDTPPAVDRPAEQAMIRETLALLRPRSGRLDDVPTEMVSMLLGEVSKVLTMLRADGWESPRLGVLEQLLDDARKHPGNRDTIRHLLDAVAEFAGESHRWWYEIDVDSTEVF